ncbi:MAG: SLC13 family permease [Phycisphaeraceae bacterium]|nr:MAG: SLC13 family permease [Phycisphaeraceae bacterium]
MTPDVLIVIVAVLGVLVLLATTRIAADAILAAALVLLLAAPVPSNGGWRMGVIPASDLLSGFSNTGMLTVGVLYIVVAGLRETGGIDWIAASLLGRPRGVRSAIGRVMGPVWAMSVFLNNTPVVAMMIPAVQDWSRRLRLPVSKLMIPLSYASILGGTCSLIGTSTNLVVAGLVISQTDLAPLRMFDITWVGLPAAAIGAGVLILLGPRLLPDRRAEGAALSDPREYTMEMRVPDSGPVPGKTVEQAGLRSLPGCFLVEIERSGEIISAVGPEQVLHAGDRLLFAGVVESIRDLANTRGLEPATDQIFKLDSPRLRRRLFEAVVSESSPLVGKNIREGRFRNRYNGAVIAVARNGERLRGKVGDVVLRAADLVLVEADPGFADRAGSSRDFLLIRPLENSTPRRHNRAPIALVILVAMVVLATAGVYPMLVAAMLAAAAIVLTRCCTITEARRSIDWSVLVVIGAALGLGKALDATGAAQLAADAVLSVAGSHPWLVLLAIYVFTSFMTEIITNNAAVALVFPIAVATATSLGVNPMPFIIAVMMAGSASFATPLGYQTNMMVYGPGGYRFGDFLRVGLVMNVVMCISTVLITPLVYPF